MNNFVHIKYIAELPSWLNDQKKYRIVANKRNEKVYKIPICIIFTNKP